VKTQINCDPVLADVFGVQSFKQTEIMRLMGKHVEKVEPVPKAVKAPKGATMQ
jgi:hypothetical protein